MSLLKVVALRRLFRKSRLKTEDHAEYNVRWHTEGESDYFAPEEQPVTPKEAP